MRRSKAVQKPLHSNAGATAQRTGISRRVLDCGAFIAAFRSVQLTTAIFKIRNRTLLLIPQPWFQIGSYYRVASARFSVSNGTPVKMIKSIGKLFAVAFGQRDGTGNVFHPTEKCPECGTPLMRATAQDELRESPTESPTRQKNGDSCISSLPHEDVNWRCPNLDCPAQIRARIEHWCSPGAMDIVGSSAALVAQLAGKGLARDVAELYRLRVAEIAALQGMDKDSAKSFFDAITASRKREAWRVLFGLGIPQVGPDQAKSLCRHFASVDNVLAASTERLMKAEGVSQVAARSVVHWHSDSVNRRLVRRLFKAGVNFKA
jgi:NAD-dependent DNA ligase